MKFRYQRIRELRLKHGHPLRLTSRLLGSRCRYQVSPGALCLWEKGKAMPSVKALMAYSELYGVEPGYFFDPSAN